MNRVIAGTSATMVSSIHLHALLLENPLFIGAPMTDEDKAALRSLGFSPRRFPARTEISAELRDGGARTLIVHSGWTCIQRFMPDGERQIIDFPLPGDVVTIGSAHTVALPFTTVTETVAFESSAAITSEATMISPLVGAIFHAAFARREAIAAERVTSLGRRSALARTAHLLLELGVRFSTDTAKLNGGFECPLTQYDIADALGLTPIHVNRMLRELREEGYLSFKQGFVEFFDFQGLAEIADFDCNYLRRRPNGLLSRKSH